MQEPDSGPGGRAPGKVRDLWELKAGGDIYEQSPFSQQPQQILPLAPANYLVLTVWIHVLGPGSEGPYSLVRQTDLGQVNCRCHVECELL